MSRTNNVSRTMAAKRKLKKLLGSSKWPTVDQLRDKMVAQALDDFISGPRRHGNKRKYEAYMKKYRGKTARRKYEQQFQKESEES